MPTCTIFNFDAGLWMVMMLYQAKLIYSGICSRHTSLSAVVIRLKGYMYAREAFRELGGDMFCPATVGVATNQILSNFKALTFH